MKSDRLENSISVYVCCNDDYSIFTVILTDKGTNKVTLLNTGTGEVVNMHQLEGISANVVSQPTRRIMCMCVTVYFITGDLTGEIIKLTGRDGSGSCPYAIAHDKERRQLIVSYFLSNSIDFFQLS